MTLDRSVGRNPADVRLVECPFCGADLTPERDRSGGARKGPDPAEHLRRCDRFEAAWRDDGGRADGRRERA